MEQSEKQFIRMTATPIPRLVSSLAVPAVVSMLVTSVYNSADTYFVSKLGTSASGAVGIVFSLMAMIQAVGFTVGTGASSLISRRLGEKKNDEANIIASSALCVSVILGLILGGAGLIFIDPLMRFLGATETILPYAKAYARYILIAAPVMSTSFVFNNLLRAEGKLKFAMFGIAAGGILNIGLDPLFIFTFNMGTAGAAVATAISQLVSMLILMSCFLLKKTIVRPSVMRVSFKPRVYFEIFKTGIPALLRQGLASIATISLNTHAAIYGDAAVAAMSIVAKIFMLVFSTALGVGQGYQPVAGYNYGARRYSRVRSAFFFTLKAGVALMGTFSLVCFIFAPKILGIFISEDPRVVEIGAFALRAQCIAMPLVPMSLLCNMTFQAVGKPWISAVISAARQGLFFLPLIYILPVLFGLRGVQTAQACADLCTFLLALPFAVVFFKRKLPKEDDTGDGLKSV